MMDVEAVVTEIGDGVALVAVEIETGEAEAAEIEVDAVALAVAETVAQGRKLHHQQPILPKMTTKLQEPGFDHVDNL